MKRMLCAALALMLLLTACAQTETPPAESPDTDSGANESVEQERPLDEASLVSGDDPAEAMRAVLDSHAAFYDVDKDEVITLDTYLKRAEEARATLPSNGADFLLGSFCNDGGMQAIVSVNGDQFLCDYFLVLHWYNGTVYGEASWTYRTFWSFKTDGSYDWSFGGLNYGRNYLAFDGEKLASEAYLWTEPGHNDANGDYTGLYYHDDKEISEDAFLALYEKELEKPDAVWHTLTAEIVDIALNAVTAPGEGEEQEPDNGLPAPAATEAEAQAFGLYREYLAGKQAAQAVCITYNHDTDKREVSYMENTFQPPDVYEVDREQSIVWRVIYFTLLDLDGDGVRELILDTSNGGVGIYEIFHCWNGQLFDNGQWDRAFCDLRADGTFIGSAGADSHSIIRAYFQEGVMEKETSAWSDWGEYHGADGASISKAEWDVLWDTQNSKPLARWYAFTEANIDAVFTAQP